jgi:hypothetical protein
MHCIAATVAPKSRRGAVAYLPASLLGECLLLFFSAFGLLLRLCFFSFLESFGDLLLPLFLDFSLVLLSLSLSLLTDLPMLDQYKVGHITRTSREASSIAVDGFKLIEVIKVKSR